MFCRWPKETTLDLGGRSEDGVVFEFDRAHVYDGDGDEQRREAVHQVTAFTKAFHGQVRSHPGAMREKIIGQQSEPISKGHGGPLV